MKPFLEVKNLSVTFPTEDGLVKASNDISFSVARGETLAVVGESGSGKSVTSLAVMGLHNRKSARISGQAILNLPTGPIDTISASPDVVRKLRGKSMAMIFQDPMSALHPYYTIGDQISEAWKLYNDGSKAEGIKRAVEMLDLVGIPAADKRVKEFPHQFSGGMRQRVMIAMALVNNPSLLIADEPTTALDVTVQSQILQLLREMQTEFNMAVILITHDLGVVAEVADRACVMYAGKIVEQSNINEIYYKPDHPYTIGLLNSIPRLDQMEGTRLQAIPGQPPSLISLPAGCSFRARCAYSSLVPNNRCATEVPELNEKFTNHFSRCHLTEAQLTSARASLEVRS
jgi:peptide/nickel transport system ATP-binding protein